MQAMHAVTDRGIAFIKEDAQGLLTVGVGASYEGNEPRGVYAVHRGVDSLDVAPEVSFTQTGDYEVSTRVVEVRATWAERRMIEIVGVPDSELLG